MAAPYCDSADLSLFTGRWVRSDSKFENWEEYMKWFDMSEQAARLETIEPQNHVITSFSKDHMTMIHQLPWRDGLQLEYTVKIDGNYYEIPPRMFKTARSSWKVNKQATWMHKWTEEGLMCEQMLPVKGKTFTLRYTRMFESGNEIRVNVRLYEPGEDGELKLAIQTVRFFHRQPFKEKWTAAAAQFFSGMDVSANLATCIDWMRKAKAQGADLIVLPENSNRDRAYFKDGKPSREVAYEMCEDLDGMFVKGMQAACLNLNMWCAVGVDVKTATAPHVNICSILIRPDGEIEGIHKKHVLWDYEYTLFAAGDEPYKVFDTELGRLALIICADGIVPEAARVMSLMGAQVLLNSLNSRGPDEMRVHIPLRSIENGVWHVASNSVGNPNSAGLLWPWTGGSEIVGPTGARKVCSESEDDMVVGEVRPFEAESKKCSWTDDLMAYRRPELYGSMTTPLDECPCAPMYGPVAEDGKLPWDGPEVVKAAMMQLSRVHTLQCTEWMTQRQVQYAARRGANVGVLPELWIFKRGEVAADPEAAAQTSARVLGVMTELAKEHKLHLCFSLVEGDGGKYYHTAYLVGLEGRVCSYRKAHLNSSERAWATQGDVLSPVVSCALGRVALMIGDEVWLPEMSRCLAIEAVEVVLHPCDWDCKEAAEMAATERGGENRFHLVSVTRLDCVGEIGSQTTFAGEFCNLEPIPLMRYASAAWCRYNVEEQIIVDLLRREPHCKMMGYHLDVMHKRFPELYEVHKVPTEDLYHWKYVTQTRPPDYKDELRLQRGSFGVKRRFNHVI